MPALILRGVSRVYPNGHPALAPVTLTIARGEAVALIGPSGAGKTSLLDLLGLVARPSAGELTVLGVSPWGLSPAKLRHLRTRIGLAHQVPPIPPRQRAVTAILAGRLGQWSTGRALFSLLYPSDIDGAHACLARFDLAERLFERCDRLSGGQLQRVGLARLLYQRPELMLADEPVSAMDPALAERSVQVLVESARQHRATLVASLHAVDLARRHFPRIVGIRPGVDGGEIAFDCTAAAVSDTMLADLYGADDPHAAIGVPADTPAPSLRGCR